MFSIYQQQGALTKFVVLLLLSCWLRYAARRYAPLCRDYFYARRGRKAIYIDIVLCRIKRIMHLS